MPDYTKHYKFPFPLGDEAPDGPKQMEDLSKSVEIAVLGVDAKVVEALSQIKDGATEADNLRSRIKAAESNLSLGVVRPKELTDLEKELTLAQPVVINKRVEAWKTNPSGGDWKKWAFSDVKRNWKGGQYPIGNIGGVAVSWSARNDLLVEEFEAYCDELTDTEFTIKVKCKKSTSIQKDKWIGNLALIVVPKTAEGYSIESDRGST